MRGDSITIRGCSVHYSGGRPWALWMMFSTVGGYSLQTDILETLALSPQCLWFPCAVLMVFPLNTDGILLHHWWYLPMILIVSSTVLMASSHNLTILMVALKVLMVSLLATKGILPQYYWWYPSSILMASLYSTDGDTVPTDQSLWTNGLVGKSHNSHRTRKFDHQQEQTACSKISRPSTFLPSTLFFL